MNKKVKLENHYRTNMKHGYRQRIPVPHKIQYYIIFFCILASVTDGHKDSVLDVVTYYNK